MKTTKRKSATKTANGKRWLKPWSNPTRQEKKKAHMQVNRALIDKDFDRYVLSSQGVLKQEAALHHAVLSPLDPSAVVRKAQWDSRAHHNSLALESFQSDATKSTVYFVNDQFELLKTTHSQEVGSYFFGPVAGIYANLAT